MEIRTHKTMTIEFDPTGQRALKLTNQITNYIQSLLDDNLDLVSFPTGEVITYEDLCITKDILSGLLENKYWDVRQSFE